MAVMEISVVPLKANPDRAFGCMSGGRRVDFFVLYTILKLHTGDRRAL